MGFAPWEMHPSEAAQPRSIPLSWANSPAPLWRRVTKAGIPSKIIRRPSVLRRPTMTWLGHRAKRQVLVVLLFFLLLNTAFYCFSPAGSFLESDSPEYLTPAYDLIATGSFSSEHRLPFYSFVLAG